MTSGQWLYIMGMEAVKSESLKSAPPPSGIRGAPRGTTYQIVKEL